MTRCVPLESGQCNKARELQHEKIISTKSNHFGTGQIYFPHLEINMRVRNQSANFKNKQDNKGHFTRLPRADHFTMDPQ